VILVFFLAFVPVPFSLIFALRLRLPFLDLLCLLLILLIAVRAAHNLALPHVSEATEVAGELVLLKLVVEAAYKDLIPGAAARAAPHILPILSLSARLISSPFAILTSTLRAASALLRTTIYGLTLAQEVICRLVAVSLAHPHLPTSDFVALVEHGGVQRVALLPVISIDFKRNKGKAPRAP
jgi:hypothetical protein